MDIYINIDSLDQKSAAVVSNTDLRSKPLKQIVAGTNSVINLYTTSNAGATNIQNYATVRLGIGGVNEVPTSGSYTVTNSSGSATINYNDSASAVSTALSSIISEAFTVSEIAPQTFKIDFTSNGSVSVPTVDSSSLSPASTARFLIMVQGSSSAPAQWLIKTNVNPIAYVDTFTNISSQGITGVLNTSTAGIYKELQSQKFFKSTLEVEVVDSSSRVQTILQVPVGIKGEVVHNNTAAPASVDTSSPYALESNLTAHENDSNNPHGVTKAQVDLGNVDNTSDASKPVSTAVQAALDDFAADPSTNGSFSVTNWLADLLAPHTKAVWGYITGTLSDQTDLQSALDDKAPIASPKFTGDVGIGATSPENKLHVVDTSTGNVTYPIRIQNDTIGDNSGVGIEFGISTSDNYTNARIQAIREDTAASAELTFLTRFDANSNLIERMRIDRSGNVSIYGDIKVLGEVQNLYNKEFAANTISGDSYNYYFDSFTGTRNLNGHLKNSKSDLIRYRPIENYEYWDGSAWVADSSKISEVEKLLDGRQDTRYDVPARDLKFRFTTSPTTSYPTAAKVGMQTTWSGSDYQGARMTVEEYDGTNWNTRVLAKFGGSNTPLETTDNGCDQWGLAFISTNKLHTGIGSATNATRITVDFYGWTPSNSSYTVIPLQSLFITTNYSGLENTDYSNLLDYNRNISAPSDLSVAGTTTAPTIVASLIKGVGNDTGTAQPINYDAKEHRFRDFDGATDFPKNMLVVQKFDGYTGARVGINKDPASDNNVALHIVAGKNSNTNVKDLGLKVIGGAFFENYVRVGHYTNSTLVTAPNNGNIVYNTDENKFQGYQAGSGWGSFVTNEPDDSNSINSIRQVDQNTYDNLTPDANTVYIIVG